MSTTALAVAIGVVIGLVIGALGGGGGVLTVPALVYLLHEPAPTAATASLVIVGVAAAVGVPVHARAGNVQWRAGAMFGAVGIAAAVAGTVLARRLPAPLLLLVFAAVIAVAATLMIRDARRSPRESPQHSATTVDQGPPLTVPPAAFGVAARVPAREHAPVAPTGHVALDEPSAEPRPETIGARGRATQALGVLAVGLSVGFMTGLFGVGGGFLAVPMLVLVMRWRLPAAIGTSLLIIVINSVASLSSRLAVESFDWHVIVPVTAAAVVGTLLGKLVNDRVSSPALGSTFGGMLILLSGYTATRSILEMAA